MSNNCTVFTKKYMTPESIDYLLRELSDRRFFGVATVEHDGLPGSWVLRFGEYATRRCWLETRRRFVMSHGGVGADFGYYVDTVIINELAAKFDGHYVDEGDGEKTEPDVGRYQDYKSFCLDMVEPVCRVADETDRELLRRWLMQEKNGFCPQPFRFDAGKQVSASVDETTGNIVLAE